MRGSRCNQGAGAVRSMLFVVTLSVSAGVATASDGSFTGVADEASGEEDAFVREIAPGHFVHVGVHADMAVGNGGDVSNGGFVVGRDAVAVIDPGGGTALARRLERALRARTSLPVTHVVLTHVHPDHVLGASVFAGSDAARGADERAAVTVVAHARYARAVAQRGTFYAERYAALLEGGATFVTPTLEVEVGRDMEIDLGGRTLDVRAWPTAHTDNDVSVFDAAGGTLWAGDLLVAERTPSLDGSLPGWLDVLGDLIALAPALVVPGHGEPGPLAPVLGAQRRYLAELLASTRADLAAGERLGDSLARAERAPGGHWQLFELHHPANVTRAWSELEWE